MKKRKREVAQEQVKKVNMAKKEVAIKARAKK